jgi:transposase
MPENTSSRPKNRSARPQPIAEPDLFVPAAAPAVPAALPVLGIDIAKATFRACLTGGGALRSAEADFPNTPEGFTALDAWLTRHGAGRTRAGLEATGHYSLALLEHLHAAGHHASLINPRWIKDYARSEGRRNKTDAVDARVIARYVEKHALPAWRPRSAVQQSLQALSRRREDAQRAWSAEKQRLKSGPAPAVAVFIKESIAHHERQIAQIDKAITALLRSSETLRTRSAHLESIPSIARLSAVKLLAELPEIDCFERVRDIAAWAGLTPALCESGTSVRRRTPMNKQGSGALRKALYMPALVLLRSRADNPLTRFRDRLLAAGKPRMVVIGALMRKLFQTACGVLKHNRPFDPSFVTATA